ncbi:hypothetical protein PSACC_03181 [Paramicrosporidium saccamoebae]|uniref:Uncharacterized protein n=1 Tax=Paramicrosporidium saccamoebae TaxID=1246581 RepID=A0A2H9TH09_9FUNG|nr:hypothetical protein PSACC_03181 [Paramicrosporidium saccamoebae]
MNVHLIAILVKAALSLRIYLGQNGFFGKLSLDSIQKVLLPMVLALTENFLPLSRMLATADNGIPSLLNDCKVYDQDSLARVLDFVMNKQPDSRRYLLPLGCHAKLGELGLSVDYLLHHRLLPTISLESDNLRHIIKAMEHIDELDPQGLFRLNQWTLSLYHRILSEYPQLALETPIHRYVEVNMVSYFQDKEYVLDWLVLYGLQKPDIAAISGILVLLLEASLERCEDGCREFTRNPDYLGNAQGANFEKRTFSKPADRVSSPQAGRIPSRPVD